jgi:hypothetical protein
MTETQEVKKQNKSVEEERKGKKVEKRKEQVKHDLFLNKKPSKILRRVLALNIPLKSMTILRAPSISTPQVKILPHTFAKLKIISIRAPCSSILTPILKVPQKLSRNIRVQVYEPLEIVKLTCPDLRFKLKPPKNLSIRPLLGALRITDLGLYNPCFVYRFKHVKRLGILPTPSIKSGEIYMPRIQIALKDIQPRRVQPEAKIEGIKETIEHELEKPPEASVEEVFVPSFLKELISSVIERSTGKPVCIVLSKKANESFIRSFAIICREIYRIVKGGKPEPRWISGGLKDEIERYLKAGDMIFIVDDPERKLLPDFSKIRYNIEEFLEKVKKELMLDRLRELFSQEFGFIIFHVNERWASQFAKILEESVGYINVIKISPPHWQLQTKKDVAKIFWGFIEVSESEISEKKEQTFDDIFELYEKRFFEELERAGKDIELTYWIEEDKEASREHESTKVIVVECLAKELGARKKDDIIQKLKKGIIKTEHELSGGGRADVYLETPPIQRFVEIETFYGRGEDPIQRLMKDTLKKYIEKNVRYVDIILLNGLQALLYANRLIKLAKICRQHHGLEVNFYLPNIKERKLIPLKDVFSMLKDVIGTSSEVTEKLTKDEVERLRNEFSQALRESGLDPEKYEKFFEFMLDCSKSYLDNLSRMLEEVKLLKESQEGSKF